jgi:hypothetical protein
MMKALSIAAVLSMAVVLSGCGNCLARTKPAGPCLVNCCAIPAHCPSCPPCAPAMPAPAKWVKAPVEK